MPIKIDTTKLPKGQVKMTWDLYNTQPISMIHPQGFEIIIAGITKTKGGETLVWNAEYLISSRMPDGMPGSGFPNTPFNETAQITFNEAENAWEIHTEDGGIYTFYQANEEILKTWDEYKQYAPDLTELRKLTARNYKD